MRLITRGDADGLACAVFITITEKIESVKFAHPKDMQDGEIDVTAGDIICNLPFHPDCYMWFDHHISEEDRDDAVKTGDFKGKFGMAPSAARLVYEYYDDPQLKRYEEFLIAVDKLDSAQLDIDDVTNPKDWMLLLLSLDPRSSLGDFEYYFFELIDWIKKYDLQTIIKKPEAAVRCEYVLSETEKLKKALKNHTKLDENVIIIDFREIKTIPMGNRFLEYTLFPEGNISLRIFFGKGGLKVICAAGHNIFKRDSKTNIGKLFAKYGGGGHPGAGTCQLDINTADEQIVEIINQMKSDG
ncbi:exopolyphosphatase [candidate division KSB1 bacterium]|nr:exopolyphosphatase [candidate division KSB1 bacterium]